MNEKPEHSADDFSDNEEERTEINDDTEVTDSQAAENMVHEEEPQPRRRYPTRTRNKPRDWWMTGDAVMIASEINDDPESYQEAMASSDASKWRKAIDTELEQIMAHNTLEKCNIHTDRKAISTKLF